MATHRIDVVSDTHGYLSEELVAALAGAELIVHAGDLCSRDDYNALKAIAPLRMCLGNNDWNYDYGPDVKKLVRFSKWGLRFQVCHYRERIDLATCDVAICGHTHRPFVEKARHGRVLVMNPGSTTFPRTEQGPTIGRLMVGDDGDVESAVIVELEPKDPGEGKGRRRWVFWD
jgi:putative phosphoesterase